MATDETIDSEDFILFDLWPGYPQQCNGQPVSYNLQGHASHNVTTAAYPVGTKFQVYNDGAVQGLKGFSTLIYLLVGTQSTTSLIAKKVLCVSDSLTEPTTITNVANSVAADLECGPVAVAIGAVADAKHGWFWCGGVCPEELCDSLAEAASQTMGGTYVAKANLETGAMYLGICSATFAAGLNKIGFASHSATTVIAGHATPIGYCWVAGS